MDDTADIVDAARRHDEAFNAHDPKARIAAMTPDTVLELPGGIKLSGSEQVIGILQVFWEAMPDVKVTVSNHVAAGDTIALEGTLTGTHTGTFRAPQGDVPATGNRIELRAAAFKTIRDGKVASEHLYFDQLDFLQQLGVLPC
jgi:steroid delta-isomerase-like uncharacterized protein